MNIVVYTHYFTPEIGAPSARVFDFSKEWVEAGHGVQVVTCFPNHPTGKFYDGYRGGLYRQERLSGIRVHRHWTYVTPNRGFIKKTLGHISYIPGALLLSHRHLTKPDVVVATSPTLFAAMVGAWSGFRYQIPFVMDVRDLWPAIFVELGVLKNPFLISLLEMLEVGLYGRAARVVTVTEAFSKNLVGRGVSSKKVHTITNGADTQFWSPLPRPMGLARKLGLNNKFVVLYIGAHGISHALSKVLDAAALIQDNPNIRFLFVGEGAEKAKLTAYAKELGLRNIQFLDPVGKEKVREFYALADVCLAPLRNISLFETFIPSKMFEIMAMGRPIIGSVAGEAADILRKSGGAFVVHPEDSEGIAHAILSLYRNPANTEKMALAGRRFVLQNYSRKTLAKRYLKVLEETVAVHRSAL